MVALARRPAGLPSGPRVRALGVDISDVDVTVAALAGADAAFYLVHAMADGEGFAARDRRLATAFAQAARESGVRRIIYPGALGHDALSPHLASRQEVGAVLRRTGIDVVELRAAVILGAGSISFEMLRSLTERLPVMEPGKAPVVRKVLAVMSADSSCVSPTRERAKARRTEGTQLNS